MIHRRLKYGKYFLILIFLIRTITSYAWSNSNASGNWNSGSSWQSGTVPVNGDGVSINSGHTITYDGDLIWPSQQIGISGKLIINGNLTISSGANLYLNSGGELVVTGTLQIDNNFSLTGVLTVGQSLIVNGTLNANTGSSMKVSNNLTVSNGFNNSGISDIDGSLVVTAGQINAAGGIIAIDGNFTANAQVGGTGTLVIGGNYVNNGGPTYATNFYVLGTKTCNSNPETCTNVKNSTQWTSDGSPASSYISSNPSWWTDHLAQTGESTGPFDICPGSIITYKLSAATDDVGAMSSNTFEWAVYGGSIVSFNGSSVSANSGTISSHPAAIQVIHGIDGTTNYTLTVQWGNTAFSGAYVAVRQTSEYGCSDGKWSIYKINVLNNNTVGVGSSSPSLCVNTTLTPITHITTGATGIGVAQGLPTGVSASWTANSITITGTPNSTGIFTYSIPLTGGCGTVTATGTITVNALPTVFNVTGGGSYCSGGSGVTVGLSGSQVGVNYQLYKDGTLTGSPVTGTGSSISFGNQISGAYTAKATNSTTLCTMDMAGSVTATIEDKVAPVINQCLPDGTVSCVSDIPAGNASYQDFYNAGGRVADNCTAPSDLKVSFVDVIDPNAGCKVKRTYTIEDASGNQATCTQTFMINDTAVPVINSVVNIYLAPNDNSCGANLTINQPTDVTENCSLVNEGAYYQYSIGGTSYSGHGSFTALFPEGTTAITWTVTDLCGHVSAQKIQTVQVEFKMTAINYDNGSTETGSGSGIQPMKTSTHEYFVDNKIPEIGYTYTWGVFQSDGLTAVNSSLYTITTLNAAHIKISFTTIPTGNYILSVIKTKNETTCKKPKTLYLTVVENTFDSYLNLAGNQCQAGETGTPSTIVWEVTFPGGGVAPYSLNYAVSLTDESNNQTIACTGSVSSITQTGTTSSLVHSSGCSIVTQMPNMQVEKAGTNSYTLRLKYTINSVTAKNFKVSIQIDATDKFFVSEISNSNNSETLDAHGVPNTSGISTD